MTTLYDINKDMLAVMKRIEAAETDEESMAAFEKFDAVNIEFNEKVTNICKYLKDLDGWVDIIDSEIKRLEYLKKVKKNTADNLKGYLSLILQAQWIEKLDLDIFKLSYRSSKSVEVIDESIIPIQYFTIKETKTVDKVWLAVYLKNWAEIPGVFLKENKSLQIK